jgi:penicillin-binding protein 1A
VWEVVLAREIEREFTKGEILEMYLNQIYLGNGLYGVEAAANGYFGKSASELDPVEAALLAAIPKAPTTYDPRRYVAAAVGRRNLVLRQMADAGLISASEAEAGKAQPLGLRPPQEARSAAPFAVAAVRRELRDRFGPEADNAGFVVHTSIDLGLQRAAEEALREQLAAVEAGRLGNFRGPRCSGGEVADASACLQGMFVALDVQSGDVLALVGGRDFGLSQFDRAYQARRQPGSAFKPVVYAAALNAGMPISTPLVGPGSDDFEGGYNPADHVSDTVSINMREGMRLSSNRAAVALGERVGVQEVIRTARALGIDTPIDPYPSTFLGAAAVSPVELVAAFTAFANYGVRVEPRLIVRVENSRGEVVYRAPVQRAAALSAETAFLANSIMQDVVDRGTGNPARAAGLSYSIPAAGKTGTTNDAADAWFVGVTPDLAAGVWIGYDQPRRIMVGAGGGRLAAPVWGRAVASYYRGRPAPAAWSPPGGVHSIAVDRGTGMRATEQCPAEDVYSEWFAVGTEPRQWCPLHYEPTLDGWIRDRFRDLRDILGTGR